MTALKKIISELRITTNVPIELKFEKTWIKVGLAHKGSTERFPSRWGTIFSGVLSRLHHFEILSHLWDFVVEIVEFRNPFQDNADRCIKVFTLSFLKMVKHFQNCQKCSKFLNLTNNDQMMSDWGNKRLNKDASCLLWWCGRDGIFGYCNMFPTRVTDDYNSTKCKIQDAEHRIDHLLIAYLKQLNRRLDLV